MTRRTRATAAQSDEDTGSLKENVGPTRTPNGKKELSKAKGKGRRVESDDDAGDDPHEQQDPEEDAEGEPDDAPEEDGAGTPKGRKRARVNAEGDSIPSSPSKSALAGRIQTLPRDEDG